MQQRSVATHTIRIEAPIDQCQRFFTPAGEELWVEGWKAAIDASLPRLLGSAIR